MNPTNDIVDKATEGLDDSLQPIDQAVEKEVVTPEEGSNVEDPSKEKEPVDDKKEDEGFAADELESTEEVTPENTEPAELDISGLTPEQKYIVESLPYMTARIKAGDTVKEVQVKSWTQLPDDVEFATKRDELAFTNSMQAQENRALQLQNKFQQEQTQQQSEDFQKRENDANRQDIAELQRAGTLTKFKVGPDDPKFAEDPATQEIQKVLDFMNTRNEQYLKEYNQGRPYRHIGFKEAFRFYQDEQPAEKTNEAQKTEDAERHKAADKVGKNQGLAQREIRKATVRSGTRTDELIDRYEAGDF